jgi:hypothetical protein
MLRARQQPILAFRLHGSESELPMLEGIPQAPITARICRSAENPAQH